MNIKIIPFTTTYMLAQRKLGTKNSAKKQTHFRPQMHSFASYIRRKINTEKQSNKP